MGACSCGAYLQLLARDACPLYEGAALRPGNRQYHRGRASERREAADKAGNDLLAPHHMRVPLEALGTRGPLLPAYGIGRIRDTRSGFTTHLEFC